MKNPRVIALLVVIATSLSACGFTLRGGDRMATISPAHLSTQLVLDDGQFALALKQPLIKHLQLLGVSEQSSAVNIIKVDHLRLHRYELAGTLTEVRLVLMADVSYTIGGQSHRTPIQVEQSYQYNKAGVALS